MNFIEAIEPHESRLDAYQKTKSYGGTDTNELRELINIFMEYVANPKGDMIPSLGCGNCISKMFQRLVTHREQERQKNVEKMNTWIDEGNKVNMDALSDIMSYKNTTEVSGEVKFIEIDNQIDLVDQIKQEELESLKAECDKQGIKYHHKAGIKKLKALLNE